MQKKDPFYHGYKLSEKITVRSPRDETELKAAVIAMAHISWNETALEQHLKKKT